MTTTRPYRTRPYRDHRDLRAMQTLTTRLWSPTAPYHVGDLAWGRLLDPTADWPITLWEHHGHVVAWAWAHLPDDLRLQIDPAHPALLPTILDWFAALTHGEPHEISVLDSEHHIADALIRRGYRPLPDDAPFFALHERDLHHLPTPTLPDGYTARAVHGPADHPRRVAVHQAAWNSRRLTTDAYRTLTRTWPYRPDLDWIIEAPDGDFAASCLLWHDPAHHVGLIEPVGTHPAHRRHGLARAVCLAALHALADAGATRAIVSPRGDAAYPVPQALYRQIGFRPYDRTRSWRHDG
ncbi:GNAT family N-acetyltransferase [Actinocorallia sp. A-T 12471]|uniref:GNAT family N-acetyltransferase n=1 Tax=Actinocorallia sp. A-T 12471 TaxID=3089813 RepID=UPI0029CAF3AE|nr:GNAT family N-acetyltransferase [Actinocorallia sp. A-T 12471]MDX6743916.1 GNAT family N-acetyltransferase [Actinocorallia sp. A-T 12471]